MPASTPDDRLIHCDTAAGARIGVCKSTTGGVYLFPVVKFRAALDKHDPTTEPTTIRVRADPKVAPKETKVAARTFCPKCAEGTRPETYDEFRARKGITRPRSDAPPVGGVVSVVVEFKVSVTTEPWRAALVKVAPRPTLRVLRESAPRAHCFRWDYAGPGALEKAKRTQQRIATLDFASQFLKFEITASATTPAAE